MRRRCSNELACLLTLLIASWLAGCNCNSSSGTGDDDDDGGGGACTAGTDLDGDGHGAGCPAGPDCNDSDDTIWDDCCASGPFTGCACDPSVDTEVICYDGPAGTEDQEPCQAGLRTCDASDSKWGVCIGQVVPRSEACNTRDDDCDGNTDEGVQSACGNCLPGCSDTGVDTDPFPFPEDDPAVDVDGVGLDENGDLVLDSSTVELHFLWIANDAEGTVSKIDTRTGDEVARYASVTHDRVVNTTGDGTRTFSTYNQNANNDGEADNRPSRTSVDFFGDVWVANRAHTGGNNQQTVTKIMNAEVDCEDRNGNGSIDTSRDINADGRIALGTAEFLAEADECIKFTVIVGARGGNARALAIDAGNNIEGGQEAGNAWVGMYEEQAFYQLNGQTGALLRRVPPAGTFAGTTPTTGTALAHRAYGAAIDSLGRLWSPSGCCGDRPQLLRIDTRSGDWSFSQSPAGSTGTYGIVVDLEDRVWLGGWDTNHLHRYDPAANAWLTTTLPIVGNVRGVAIDTRGNVWAVTHPGGAGIAVRVWADNPADPAHPIASWSMNGVGGNSSTPVGIGVDFDGDVWSVNQGSSNASRLHIDPTSGEPAAHGTTGNQVDVFPVGLHPYTYSDFTGLSLRTVTRPSGDYRVPLQGCTGIRQATWTQVTFDASTPPGTRVEIYVQVGDDLATLETLPLFGPWTASPAVLSAAPGPVPPGRFLLLTIRLISEDRESTPIVHSYSVQRACPGGVD